MLFQHQGKAEPVSGAPEATTVDRWQPTCPPPQRPLMAAAAMAAVLFAPSCAAPASLAPESTTADRYRPTHTQPDRTPTHARGTDQVAPVSESPESTTPDRWASSWVQPGRASRYASGTDTALPTGTTGAVTTSADRWVSSCPGPGRTPRYAAGTAHTLPPPGTPESTTADRWAPTSVSPARAPRSAPGTDQAGPVSLAAEATTVDRWAPAWVQPGRIPRPAPGTDHAGALVPIIPAATSADRWAPTVVQPGRAPRYAAGTSTAGSPHAIIPVPTSADRFAPTFVQPGRIPRSARGTDQAGPVSLAPEATSLERWLPSWIQPGRVPRYAPGLTTAGPLVPIVPAVATVDLWLPVWVQPARTLAHAAGTAHVGAPAGTAVPSPGLPCRGMPGSLILGGCTLGGPVLLASPPPDVPSALVARLAATVATPFGHGPGTPKFHADEMADPQTALPYLVYAEPEETPRRFFGGRLGEGTIEFGVFHTGKESARVLMDQAAAALEGMSLPVRLGDLGLLTYVRREAGSGRAVKSTAPGSGVTQYGRTLAFRYRVTRPESTGATAAPAPPVAASRGTPGSLILGGCTLGGPALPAVPPPDVPSALVARLAGMVGTAFGHTGQTPKFHADEMADPGTALPYLVYSEADETPRRYFGGRLGEGAIELGVFHTGKESARVLMDAAADALEGMALPLPLADGGLLTFVRRKAGSGRPIRTTAPGSGVTQHGRALTFQYRVTRPE